MTKLRADFNGIFATENGGLILCLSHGETSLDAFNNEVTLVNGMLVTAFEPDSDELGNPDDLIANGTVIPSPHWLKCSGSRWSLDIDDRGWYHESDVAKI